MTTIDSLENGVLGAFGEVVPPLSIPNREVKHFSADGTSMRESRSVPRTAFFNGRRKESPGGIFLLQKMPKLDMVVYRRRK